jgi:hypothetical protein
VVKAQRMVTCIFCGLRRPKSVEDVISKWIRRTLNPATEVIIRAEPTGAVSRLQHLTVTLEDMVCQECNNTWMSRLENRGVKPFLEPMLTGKHAVTLDETQQHDLARWAIIKVLLMEHAMRQRRAHLRPAAGYAPSDPELAWLYGNDDPPPRSRLSWTRSRIGASQRRSPPDTCRCLPAVDLASVLARRAEREPESHLAGEADDLTYDQAMTEGGWMVPGGGGCVA